ncbi:MAG: dephospho-CoA kinase [Ignavibacteriaceae bacterium]|nr:dephospho-CoA kinase [Ignavibacteriaceae bacterium]
MSRPAKIAVTGGIGSGKSLFCKYLAELGETILFADTIAKKLMAEDVSIREKIIGLLGSDSYLGARPNNQYIASKVFTEPELLAGLNSIVHPAVGAETKILMDEVLKEKPRVFYEAALIFEARLQKYFDKVVLITAPDELRIRRAMERDNISREKVEERMRNQMNEITKSKLAGIIIMNDQGTSELYAKAVTLLKELSNDE